MKEINLKVEAGQKIAFIGSNGIGKSTLLKSLMGLIPSLDGEVEKGNFQDIAYYEQEIKNPSQIIKKIPKKHLHFRLRYDMITRYKSNRADAPSQASAF